MSYYTKNLKPTEVVVTAIKKYYLTFLGQFILAFITVLLPFFLLYLFFQWGRWGMALFIILIIFGIINLSRFLVSRHYNLLVITNQRLIYYKQKGLFKRHVFEIALNKIQDISYEILGATQTIFGYGSLKIQVVNSNTLIIIEKIKSPQKVQDLINKTIENQQFVSSSNADQNINTVI